MSHMVDYTNVTESQNFEPLPEGEYGVTIEKVVESLTKETGRPLIKIQYNVVNGKNANRKLFDNIVIFEGDAKGAGITKHFLHVIDEPYEGKFAVNPDNWVGKSLTVKVTIDEQWNSNKIVSREVYSDLPF